MTLREEIRLDRLNDELYVSETELAKINSTLNNTSDYNARRLASLMSAKLQVRVKSLLTLIREVSGRDLYIHSGKEYAFFSKSKMKISGEWKDVVIYEALYDNPEGRYFVRYENDFNHSFLRHILPANIDSAAKDKSSVQAIELTPIEIELKENLDFENDEEESGIKPSLLQSEQTPETD